MVRLQRKVERMEAALPLLIYVGGEILPLDHWLELPRMTTMEGPTFGEVLGASDLFVQKAQDLEMSIQPAGVLVVIWELMHCH